MAGEQRFAVEDTFASNRKAQFDHYAFAFCS
jgi:hypothetical protein